MKNEGQRAGECAFGGGCPRVGGQSAFRDTERPVCTCERGLNHSAPGGASSQRRCPSLLPSSRIGASRQINGISWVSVVFVNPRQDPATVVKSDQASLAQEKALLRMAFIVPFVSVQFT